MSELCDRLLVCSDSVHLSESAVKQFVGIVQAVLDKQENFTVCLSGGQTPRGMYRLLAIEPYRGQVPWQRVHVFWGDERCLPLNHSDDHYRMASDLMLSKVPIPAENIHRMQGEIPDPISAAEEYEELLRMFFGLEGQDLPRFDLILLGMGEDGHTASLFPGTNALQEMRRLVVANYVPGLGAMRLTLTMPVINRAYHIMFLVSGESKIAALRRVFRHPEDESKLPVGRVRPDKGNLLWLVDEDAAVGLKA